MDLKDFFSKEKTNQDFFWALVLEPGLIQAAIWTISEGKAQIISISNPISWSEDEELLNACDSSLSSAIQNFPEDIGEPTKTVFGVSSKWVENGEIKPEYIEKIKKICNELSLEPSGFVILSEAIAHLIKSEEGSPLSAVIIAVREENIEVSLFKLGNLIGTTSVARSVSLPDDVVEGLSRFGISETYPSRFLIYDGKEGELEEIKQNLLSYDWEKGEKIKFLHTPKIEIINPERKVTATALAGASEISDVKSIESLDKKEDEEIPKNVENVSPVENNLKPEDLGFMVGEDVVEKTIPLPENNQIISQKPKEFVQEPQKKKNTILEKIKKISLFFKEIFKKTPKQKIDKSETKKTFIYGGVVFTIILIIGLVLWWFLPKATLTIYVVPKKLEDKINLVVDISGNPTNINEGIVSGETLEIVNEGEKTKTTTGTKTVGEKARGTVKIQNGTSSPIKLSAGTQILSSGDLEFTIDNSASISAAISPSLPGEANLDVTAYGIGAGYNLAKDEIFKVSNYPKSDVDAIAIANFSGGTSREISAVSENDQKVLLDELTKELSEDAKTEIKSKIGEGQYLIEDSIIATASSKIFSNKVGDEASNIKLSLKINTSGVVVKNSDYYEYVKNSLKDQIPSGYVLRNDQVSLKFSLDKVKDQKYSFSITVQVNLLPQIDLKVITEKVKGRTQKVVENYLTTVPGFTRADINYHPRLPGKLNTFPHLSKNITIELSTER